MEIFALVACLCGIYTITAAALNWNWFFENYRATIVVSFLGREKARVFYGTMGGLMLGAGIAYLLLRS